VPHRRTGKLSAHRRHDTGHWLIPVASLDRTLDGSLDYWMARTAQR
jgi:hypothetical protein